MTNDPLATFRAFYPHPLLALPASDVDVLSTIIEPALALLPKGMDTPEARVQLLAIGRQESDFQFREQVGGPAHGLWMFEMGGVQGVMRHPASASYCRDLCAEREVAFAPLLVYQALATDDVLAAGMARLLLWTDAAPLPGLGQQDQAWAYYLRNWRPGKPGPARWPVAYQAAMMAVRGAP